MEIGQKVMVSEFGGSRSTPGEIVKIGRTWIDVHREGRAWGWRFRLDDQTDGSARGLPPRFYTLDQWAKCERERAASAFLREQGITIGYASPWRERVVELATLLGWTAPTPD